MEVGDNKAAEKGQLLKGAQHAISRYMCIWIKNRQNPFLLRLYWCIVNSIFSFSISLVDLANQGYKNNILFKYVCQKN